jgi:hypothetical protein
MRTATEEMEVHAAMFARGLGTSWFGSFVQCPIPSFPVIDAAALQLWQRAEHRPAGGSNQRRPFRQLCRSQFTSVPHRSGRIHDEVSAVGPGHENQGPGRKGDVTTVAGKEDQGHTTPARDRRPRTVSAACRRGAVGRVRYVEGGTPNTRRKTLE